MNSNSIRKSGFTLVELLVVISIIGLLASVIIATLNSAQARGRDARLIADTQELAKAINLYYQDHGRYPPHTSDGTLGGTWMPWVTSIRGDSTDPVLKAALEPYMKKLPDPGEYNSQWYKGSVRVSRITYTLPYNNYGVFVSAGVECSPRYTIGNQTYNAWGATGRCFVLTIETETETPIGPAERPISFVNGTIIVQPPATNQWWWGLW